MQELFALIKSLKPAEKRYFKVFSNTGEAKKKPLYEALFDAFDKCEKYEDEEFLKKYRTKDFVKNFAENKNYLYNQLLESLRNYNEENITEWQLKRDLQKIKILSSKGLDQAANRLMERTKTKAWQYEQYYTLDQIIELQLYMFGNCRIGNMEKAFYWDLQQERDKIRIILDQYNTSLSTWHQLNILFLNPLNEPFEEVVKQATRLIFHPLMQNEPQPELSLSLRNRYLACFELYYNSIGDAKKCYESNKRIIENRALIDEKMPNFAVDAMAVYFNFMVACFKYKQWDEMEEYLIKTKNYPISSIEQEIRRTHNYCYNGILLYLATNQHEKAKEIINVFFEAKKKYEGNYRIDFLLFTQSQCGWYYFVQKEYDEAMKIWRGIIDGPKYSVEIRAQATTRIYEMILHYEKQDLELLDYLYTNTLRYIKTVNLLGKREKVFFDYFKKIISENDPQNNFAAFFKALKGVDTPITEKSIVNDFIIDWVERKA
jgi:high-affinity Fe2+/Pb2+ permease